MIRLLLVEDEPLISRGLCMWLEQAPDEVRVIGEAHTHAEALLLAHELSPDVILMDLEGPYVETIAATAALSAEAPQSAVVLLSLHDNASRRREAQAAGAYAFVGKQEGVPTLWRAIHDAGRKVNPSPRVEGWPPHSKE